MSKKSFRQAINETLFQEMRRDPTVIVMGEDIAGGADIGALGERRVEHPLAAEFADQPLGHAQHAAPGVVLARRAGTAGDVLALLDHRRIETHFLKKGLDKGLAVTYDAGHGYTPLNKKSILRW